MPDGVKVAADGPDTLASGTMAEGFGVPENSFIDCTNKATLDYITSLMQGGESRTSSCCGS